MVKQLHNLLLKLPHWRFFIVLEPEGAAVCLDIVIVIKRIGNEIRGISSPGEDENRWPNQLPNHRTPLSAVFYKSPDL